MRRSALLVVAVGLMSILARTSAAQVETVAAFDASKAEFPENLAIDGNTGDVYVSMLLIGQVIRVTPDHQKIHYLMPPGTFLTGGLVFNDYSHRLYVALTGATPANTGVWEVDPDGSVSLYSHVAGGMLNGMTSDKDGDLFVADSVTGFIWKAPAGGGEASVWVDLHAPGMLMPPGPNGIKLSPRGDLYVSITNQQKIVRIRMLPNGSAGPVTTVVQSSDLAPDDLAFDVSGNLYVANNNYLTDPVPTSTIERIHPDGTRDVLAGPADGLFFTTAVQFGKTPRSDRHTIYFTNGALSPVPALMKLTVDNLGYPVASWCEAQPTSAWRSNSDRTAVCEGQGD